jgi:hypothetical protein
MMLSQWRQRIILEGPPADCGDACWSMAERRTRRVMVRMPALPPRASLSSPAWRSPSVPTRGAHDWGLFVYRPTKDEP